MVLVRSFQQKEGVWVFDSSQESGAVGYEAQHLEVLARAEEGHFWFKHRRDKICHLFQRYVPRGARVLEIGGGTGFVASQLQKLGFSVEISDLHLNGLQHAKKRGLLQLYQFDLFQPPFREEFDVVCLFDVLEHLHDPLRALCCLKSMLKPQGMIILTVPAHRWLWSREDVIAGHCQRFTKRSLGKLFDDAELHGTHMRYFFSAILPLLWMRKWVKRDDRSARKPDEVFEIKMSPLFNTLCDFMTRSEFYLDRFVPNWAGGSLIAVASHKTL